MTLYVGAASGGVWKSVDGGTTFKPVFDKQPVQSIGAVDDRSEEPEDRLGRHRRVAGRATASRSATASTSRPTAARTGRTWACAESERIAKILVDPTNSQHRLRLRARASCGATATSAASTRRPTAARRGRRSSRARNLSTGCSMISHGPPEPEDALSPACGTSGARAGRSAPAATARRRPAAAASSSRPTAARPGPSSTRDAPRASRRSPGAASRWPSRRRSRTSSTRSSKRCRRRTALYRSDDGGETWEARDRSQNMVWRPFYFANLIVDPKNENRVYKPDLALIAQQRRRQELQRHRRRRARRLPRRLDRPDEHRPPDRGRRRRRLVLLRRREQVVEGRQPADLAVLPRERRHGPSVPRLRRAAGQQLLGRRRRAYPGGITNAQWENMYGGDGFWMFADPTDPDYIYAECAGRRHRARQPQDARDARHQAAAGLQGRQAALQLEHADPHEPDAEGHDLHRRAVPVPLARPRPDLGAHLARPDDQRSREAEAGAVGRRHGRQLRRRDAHDDLRDRRVAEGPERDLGRHRRRQRAAHARRRQDLDERRRQRRGPAEERLGLLRSRPATSTRARRTPPSTATPSAT